jgi:hypothetical protein
LFWILLVLFFYVSWQSYLFSCSLPVLQSFNGDNDLVAEKKRVSIVDPLVKTRLTCPARGKHCTHIEVRVVPVKGSRKNRFDGLEIVVIESSLLPSYVLVL